MDDPVEVELKLVVAPGDIRTLLDADWVRAAAPADVPLAATYFDTPDHALAAAGFVLRIRRGGGAVVQTVKAVGDGAAGLFARPEWNCAMAPGEAVPRLDAAAGPLAEMVDAATLAALAPRFSTAVQRSEARIVRDDAVVLLAVDRGSVSAAGRSDAVCEIELELVAGPAATLFALARAVDALVPARLGVLSKAERGYRLAAGSGQKAARAEPVALDRGMAAGTAFAAIAHACLRQFRLNEDMLAANPDPAVLHQARVGLRRLRSSLSLFRPLFDEDPIAEHHRGELRWLQQTFGDARDIDVLIGRIGTREDNARLALARAEAYAAVGHALASPRARGLMLDSAEWIALGGWRTGNAAARPIEEAAADMLDRHHRRIARRGRRLATLDDAARHQVRIEAKKLRYASEFLASLYRDGKAARRHAKFVRKVAALQETLGLLNDLATAPPLVERFGLPALPPVKKGERKALIADAADAWEELVDAKRFWR